MAARLQQFSVTEGDSAWQILHAYKEVHGPETRAKMFQHALEEVHHASEFERVAMRFTLAPPARPRPKRIPIYDPSTEKQALVHFLAFAHVGEQDVFNQFSSYAAAVGDEEVRDVFLESKRDEQGHVGLTLQMLRRTAPTDRLSSMTILRVRLRRLYEGWLRFSAFIGHGPTGTLLSVLYLTSGAVLSRWCRGLFVAVSPTGTIPRTAK
jgi:rubrerythrin